ncbi:ABC transporter substrate-binding protein [Paenibacillus sp. P26]|nr:ABC transporter substrate-binding protein [Paenibacillus sp. P26]
MKGKKKLHVVLTLVFSLSFLLYGCSGQSGGADASGATGSSKSGSHESVFRIAMGNNPKIIGYPAEVTNNGPLPYLDPVLQALARFDEKGNLVPWLAESWETDAKAKTITFKLRKGVKYSDNTDFDAESVKWNIEKYIDNKRSETNNIESMEVVDPGTLRLHLKEWNSSTLQAVGYFVRYISPATFKAHDKEWAYKNPVGTGPYLLDKWQVNVSVSYKKNPGYWEAGKPKTDRIEMLIIEDAQTAASALKAGEVDEIQAGNIDIAKELIDSKKFDVVLHKNGVGAVGVGIIPDSRTKGSPFADVRVRQAMSYAIDEKAIAETFGKGYYVTTNQWGAPDAVTYNKEVAGYPYNPQKAKQLLAEAGYPNGFKTKLFSGASTKDPFTAVQNYLEAVGIHAELVVVDEAKVQDLYFNTWEGGLMGHFHSVQPDLGLYMYRHLDPNGAFYAKGIDHPDDVLQLLKENQQAPNDQVKTDTSMKIQKLVYDKYDIFGKPLYIPMGIFIKQKYVKDDGFGITHLSYWTPGDVRVEK